MKKLLFLFVFITLCSCVKQDISAWEIEKKDGTKDTIIAKSYWLMSPDSQFIKLEVDDSTRVVYFKSGLTSIKKINPRE